MFSTLPICLTMQFFYYIYIHHSCCNVCYSSCHSLTLSKAYHRSLHTISIYWSIPALNLPALK